MKFERLLTAAGMAAVLIGCALLPTGAAYLRDHSGSGETGSVTIAPVAFAQSSGVSPVEKLRRIVEGEFDEGLEVGTGVNYTYETILGEARIQCVALNGAGLLPVPLSDDALFSVEQAAYLISSSEPSCNILLWTVEVTDAATGCLYELLLDDDTGKTLYLRFDGDPSGTVAYDGDKKAVSERAQAEVPARFSLAEVARGYAAYLGCELVEGYDVLAEDERTAQEEREAAYGVEEDGKAEDLAEQGKLPGAYWWSALAVTLRDGDSTATVTASGEYRAFQIGVW